MLIKLSDKIWHSMSKSYLHRPKYLDNICFITISLLGDLSNKLLDLGVDHLSNCTGPNILGKHGGHEGLDFTQTRITKSHNCTSSTRSAHTYAVT